MRFGEPRTLAMTCPRLKGLLDRVDETNTYRVTLHGLRVSAFFARLITRVKLGHHHQHRRPLTFAWRTH